MEGNYIQPKCRVHIHHCAHIPGVWRWFVWLCSHRADSMCSSWWAQRLHLLFAPWLSSQEPSLPFLHLLLFFCALVAAVMIQGTASAACGNWVFPVSSLKAAKHHHSWAAASCWSEHLSFPWLRVTYCLCFQERFTLHRAQSLLLPYTMFLPSVEMSSCLFHMSVLSATPHKEMNCCLFRYGNVQLWVSAKQLSTRGTVLFQVPGRDRCESCQLLTLPCC